MKSKVKFLIVPVILIFFLFFLIALPYLEFSLTNYHQLIDNKYGFVDTIKEIKDETSFRCYYKDKKKDIISLYYQKRNKSDVNVDGQHLLLSKEGFIYSPSKIIEQNRIEDVCNNINNLKDYSNKNGARFLYVFAPDKNLFITQQDDQKDANSFTNYNNFIKCMNKNHIDTLDLAREMRNENKTINDFYFVNDGHWRPEAGFWANNKICVELNKKYNFRYSTQTTNLSNYNISKYNNWFLGKQGQTVGQYFSPLGIDDISLITPKFDTSLSLSQPFDNYSKNGTFSETLINPDKIKYKNAYFYNTYACYSDGDHRLQIIKNNNAPNNEKILIVRTSYACVVTPFLSLNCKELHIVDIRNYDYLGKDKLNLPSYISKVKPNYVIVLYNSLDPDGGDCYNFFN
ncbi:MAG: hypothetical protein IJT65_02155 [Eubacterium sp.]|nr:hypothetical protein [Eubacterium sp.]